MNLKKKSSGVTLIELLIVLVIMMTLVGLVGSLGLQTLKKAQAQTEFISVCGLIRKASVAAFASGGDVKVVFSGATATVFLNNEFRNQHMFSHLYFDQQTIRFNRNGIANLLQMKVNMGGVQRIVDVMPLLENSVTSHVAMKNESES